MSRSVADATRFTATRPHAYTRTSARSVSPNPSSSRIDASSRTPPLQPPASSDPPGETPAQKVARLRAAHLAKRASQVSTWDKIVVRGRQIADTVHRVTVIGLIGLTVVAGGITVFSLGDMIVYNRRKRKEYLAEQQTLLRNRTEEAREAFARGVANEDQMLLLNRERAAIEAEEQKRNKKTMWKSFKSMFSFEGLKPEDPQTLQGMEQGTKQEALVADEAPVPDKSRPSPRNEPAGRGGILGALEEKRRRGERELERQGAKGGALDRIGNQASSGTKDGSSWIGWLRPR